MENGNVCIGEEAKNEQKGGNVNTVAFYKSMMANKDYSAYIDGEEYSAEDLSGIFLTHLKRDIEETNGIEIDGAVITVPAYFNDNQREATIRAGQGGGHIPSLVIEGRAKDLTLETFKKCIRKVTPLECERLNGFPNDWTDTGMPEKMRYFCMGNALVVPIVERIAKQISVLK